MNFWKLLIMMVILAVVVSAKKPKRRRRRFGIEEVSKNSTSYIGRFKPFKKVKIYFVSISVKYLADVSSHYYSDFNVSTDLNEDGYFEINAVKSLQPGTLYELDIYNKKKFSVIRSVDFYTDCDEYSFQCYSKGPKKTRRQFCLSGSQICDGTPDCGRGEDERRSRSGNCANAVRERPTPPPPSPPPADAPCILALEKAERESTKPLPECDINGLFQAMRCGSDTSSMFTCNCIHPETGETLFSQPDFDPFTNWNFNEKCDKARKTATELQEAD